MNTEKSLGGSTEKGYRGSTKRGHVAVDTEKGHRAGGGTLGRTAGGAQGGAMVGGALRGAGEGSTGKDCRGSTGRGQVQAGGFLGSECVWATLPEEGGATAAGNLRSRHRRAHLSTRRL